MSYEEVSYLIETFSGKKISGFGNLPKEVFIAKDQKDNAGNKPSKVEITVNRKNFSVDLRSGEFHADGVKWSKSDLFFGEDIKNLDDLKDFRLIYFRRVYKTITEVVGTEVSSETWRVYLGYQVTANGKNYQRKIAITPDGRYYLVNE